MFFTPYADSQAPATANDSTTSVKPLDERQNQMQPRRPAPHTLRLRSHADAMNVRCTAGTFLTTSTVAVNLLTFYDASRFAEQ
jgi:hypothetical protein